MFVFVFILSIRKTMGINGWERKGLSDLLKSETIKESTFSVAKIVSKSMLQPRTIEEAINVIILHSTSTQSILSRKSITKENLFRYLHYKNVPVTSEFTKQLLIEKILQFWKKTFYFDDDDDDDDENCDNRSDTSRTAANINNKTESVIAHPLDYSEEFPINKMSRKFATWFFENLNSSRLQTSDFWSNCKCLVHFLEDRQILLEEESLGAAAVLEFCMSLQTKYGLYLNLNISHLGTQGRIDCHGIVLVLTCGTLHKVNQFVGTFECVFGISRDPFSQNNWKINQMNVRLHNFGVQNSALSSNYEQPTLIECDSMIPLLCLEMPENEID